MDQRVIYGALLKASRLRDKEDSGQPLSDEEKWWLATAPSELYGDAYEFEFEDDEFQWGIKEILNAVFVTVMNECPDALPGLFPLFAMFSGDRKNGSRVAEINWEIATPDKKDVLIKVHQARESILGVIIFIMTLRLIFHFEGILELAATLLIVAMFGIYLSLVFPKFFYRKEKKKRS